MTNTIYIDGWNEALWDGCDLVIETTVGFYLDIIAEDDQNWKSLELTIEDRFCAEDLEHFSAVHFRFSESLIEDE